MTKPLCIYVIGTRKGPKKVGVAVSASARLPILQTGSHARLSVFHSREIDRAYANAIERRAHWLLEHKRVRGEWFDVGLDEARQAVDQAVADRGQGEIARSPVGRPPMNNKPTIVRLPPDVLDRVDALAGNRRRADYIRKAVIKQVEADERTRSRREREKRKGE